MSSPNHSLHTIMSVGTMTDEPTARSHRLSPGSPWSRGPPALSWQSLVSGAMRQEWLHSRSWCPCFLVMLGLLFLMSHWHSVSQDIPHSLTPMVHVSSHMTAGSAHASLRGQKHTQRTQTGSPHASLRTQTGSPPHSSEKHTQRTQTASQEWLCFCVSFSRFASLKTC